MNKALIAPIVALILTLVKQAFGLKFDDETTNIIIDGALALVTLAGIFMNPKKEIKKDEME
jgi:uncharacterized membrane protein